VSTWSPKSQDVEDTFFVVGDVFGLFRLRQVDPVQATVHIADHRPMGSREITQGESLVFHLGQQPPGFRIIQVPAHDPAIASRRQEIARRFASAQGEDGGLMPGQLGCFLGLDFGHGRFF
jgi:hypothetical protein